MARKAKTPEMKEPVTTQEPLPLVQSEVEVVELVETLTVAPEAPLEVKEIVPSQAKSLKIGGTAFVLETGFYRYDFRPTSTPEGFVSILNDSGRTIGGGVLKRVGKELVVEGEIEAATPERLSLENGERLYFHHVGGITVIEGRNPNMLDIAAKIDIRQVVLSTRTPFDSKISKVNILL